MDEKKCSKCGETKALDEFYVRKSGRISSPCKECAKRVAREWSAQNKERKAAADRAWRLANTERKQATDRAWRRSRDLPRLQAEFRSANSVKRCPRCGEGRPLAEFNVDNGNATGLSSHCRECTIAANRAWWLANAGEIAERRRAAYRADLEKSRRVQRERYAALSDEERAAYLERSTRNRRDNPHHLWSGHYRYEARRRGLDPVVEHFTKPDVIERWGDACFYCDGGFEELDHYVPTSKGGPHTLENVRPSCLPCNRMKQDKHPDEWLAEQAELDDLTEDELDDLIDAEIERWTE